MREIILIPAIDTLIGPRLRRNPCLPKRQRRQAFIVRVAIQLLDLILLSQPEWLGRAGFSKRRRTMLQIFIRQYHYHISSIALFGNFENRKQMSIYEKRELRDVPLLAPPPKLWRHAVGETR